MSWRESASHMAQDDLDGLLNLTLPFAQQMLDQRREFYPFAGTINNSGEPSLVAGDPGQGNHPASADVLATLVEAFRAKRKRIASGRHLRRCATQGFRCCTSRT
jgi:hypothetical protein